MRVGWTALACVLGCGEIREVPVGGTSSSSSGSEETTTGSSTSGDASTTPQCTGDCDTDPSPTGMDLVTSTTAATTEAVPMDRTLVCWHEGAPIRAGDRAGGAATVVVEPGLQVRDVDVLVRVSHERPQSIRVTLAREGVAIDLLHNVEGDRRCRVDLAVRFDDDASAPASAYCEQLDDPAVLAPVMPIDALLGDDAAGPWTLTAIVPSSAAGDGTLVDVCLALALDEA